MNKKSLEGFPEQFSQNIEDADHEKRMDESRNESDNKAALMAQLANELAKREKGDEEKVEAIDVLHAEAKKEDELMEYGYERKVDDLVISLGLKKEKSYQGIGKDGEKIYGKDVYWFGVNDFEASNVIKKSKKENPELFDNPMVMQRFLERTSVFDVLRHISERLKQDKIFLHGMIKRKGIDVLKYFPEDLRNNPGFILEVVGKNPDIKFSDLKGNISGDIYWTLESAMKNKTVS